MFDGSFIKRIQDALGTAEEGEALIEVVRNAHKAEQELAIIFKEGCNKDIICYIQGTIK